MYSFLTIKFTGNELAGSEPAKGSQSSFRLSIQGIKYFFEAKYFEMLPAISALKHLLGIGALDAHQGQQQAHNDDHFEELAGLQTKTRLVKSFPLVVSLNFRLTTCLRCIFEPLVNL